ncbi:unnamed protein product [Durusdinium trenchii]|uniref:Uncharacterized protein n=1 Tax=Durusdinium trenchii TaxID=1381693 RepID=A0ABP0IY99_9DINO
MALLLASPLHFRSARFVDVRSHAGHSSGFQNHPLSSHRPEVKLWRHQAFPAALAVGLGRTGRRAYEPFGGIYAREYALRRGSPLKPEQSWIFFPALAFALTIAWQVFHNWTRSLIALLIISFLAQCYMPEWEETRWVKGLCYHGDIQ